MNTYRVDFHNSCSYIGSFVSESSESRFRSSSLELISKFVCGPIDEEIKKEPFEGNENGSLVAAVRDGRADYYSEHRGKKSRHGTFSIHIAALAA
jgi:hypothetical protein